MERQLQSSPRRCSPTENDDVKYVSGLSTILVATIQEAKDRISQIEYIFCSQLFPNFQSKSKLLHGIYTEARKAADEEWKEKESALLLRIERLEHEKQETLEENRSLKQRESGSQLLARIETLQLKVEELELDLQQKSKEVDEGLKLQYSLLQLNQSKASEIVNKGKQLKEREERTTALLAELSGLERNVSELQDQLREKTEEVVKGNELKRNLFKKIESQAFEIMNNEQLLRDQEKEKKVLTTKLGCLEETVCQLRSCQKGNSNGLETLKRLEESERENKLLLAKVNALEEKINELLVDLSENTNDVTKGSDFYQRERGQIESITAELLAEKKKRKEVIDAYKKLKSQYNFLCEKSGLSIENMISPLKLHVKHEPFTHNENQIPLPDTGNHARDTSLTASVETEPKGKNTINNHSNNENQETLVRVSTSLSPKCPSTVKPATLVGTKRRASCWRDTRSHQGQNGPDPHDDFLDTPLENVRGNLDKATRKEACELRNPAQKDEEVDDSSEDETQDVNADQNPHKNQMPVTKGKGFKFVEPVRKKADRENLKGVECRQCKKFYDAVLCGDDKDGKGKHNIRCEHHEGVSRHRYRYVPPMTPEGFWNIGFESEN